jgi:hypothetical protein
LATGSEGKLAGESASDFASGSAFLSALSSFVSAFVSALLLVGTVSILSTFGVVGVVGVVGVAEAGFVPVAGAEAGDDGLIGTSSGSPPGLLVVVLLVAATGFSSAVSGCSPLLDGPVSSSLASVAPYSPGVFFSGISRPLSSIHRKTLDKNYI